MKQSLKRLLSLILATLLMLCAMPAMAADTDNLKGQLNELNNQLAQLEKQQTAIQKEMDKAKTDKAKQLALKKQLDNQIYGVREQIALLTDKIDLLENNITKKEGQLGDMEGRIAQTEELLKRRLRVMYTTGNATVLGLVLGADNYTEFLTRSQVASRVAEHDQTLIFKMQEELRAINTVKDEIQSAKEEVEAAKKLMAQKQNELGSQLAKTTDLIQDIEALEKEYKANKSKIDKEMATVQSEVADIYKQFESVGNYDGGIMLWPVAGYNTVTSQYGWRFNNTDYHTGIDIARTNAAGQGIYGKPILAAANGKVVFTQPVNLGRRDYGIYVIIDHGGGISSLYAHQSGLKVKHGQTVKRGEVIGYVGSTGWSTGPHLHFEVRVNGKHVNPWGYLRGK